MNDPTHKQIIMRVYESIKNALRVTIVPGSDPMPVDDSAKNPKITIKNSLANTKNSHLFQNGCRQFLLKSEKITEIKCNFNETEFDNNAFLTVTSGGFLKVEDVYLENITLYFKCDKNCDVEILEWHD